jgi:hypothetical protein
MGIQRVKRAIERQAKDKHRGRLLKLIPTEATGVEIGVWRGDWAAELLERTRPRRLFLVDPWTFQPEFKGSWFGGAIAKSQADMDQIYETVVERFAAPIAAGQVIVHRCPSAEAPINVPLDWVYVDGNHSYEYVRDDLEKYGALVRAGGLVIGDDYGRFAAWWGDGVLRAFDDYIASGVVEKLQVRGRQIVLRKRY